MLLLLLICYSGVDSDIDKLSTSVFVRLKGDSDWLRVTDIRSSYKFMKFLESEPNWNEIKDLCI